MTLWYMTGQTRCRNMDNAMDNIARYRKPAVIRRDGRFYDVTRLQDTPVQPGQRPFTLWLGEKVYNT